MIGGLCQEIALEPLRESEIAEYLTREFGSHRFPAALADIVRRHSDGAVLPLLFATDDVRVV